MNNCKMGKQYCSDYKIECEYIILTKEDERYVAWESSHVVAWGS
jgi:hypothetical protein